MAVALLVGLAVYSWIATLVPLESIDPAEVAAWDARHPGLAVLVNALWLHRAYSSPVFIAVALFLTASTSACAWERMRTTIRTLRSDGRVSQTAVHRLRRSPTVVVEVGPAVTREQALDGAGQVLRGMRMRVKQGPALVHGSSGAVGLVGSPLFHWSLVGLFVLAGAAQLTRYEGWANVLVGESIEDARSSYPQRLDLGLLAGGAFTGLDIAIREVLSDPVVDGIPRGETPVVAVERGGVVVREQMVYANNPLRRGPLLIHNVKTGPAFVGTVRSAASEQPQRVVLHYELGATSPQRFGLSDPSAGGVRVVEVSPAPGKRVTVAVRAAGVETRTVGVGESVALSEYSTLTVDALTVYVRLHVVNDWSIPWIYAVFGFGSLASALAVFVAPRAVLVMAVDASGGRDGSGLDPSGGVRLHVVVRHRRSDPAFPRRVQQALSEALATDTASSQREEVDA